MSGQVASDEFDAGSLADWLTPRIDGLRPPLTARRFSGGQSNPTFMLEDAQGHRYVLRKKPAGALLPSAHAIDREFRVMKALESTAVPVARMLCYCDDASVIGTAFYVMAFIEGRIFWDPALPGLQAEERARTYSDMNRVVAALHRIDPGAVGLEDYGRPGNFLERQLSRWTRQYEASATERIDAMDRLIEWLPRHVPVEGEARIFHGDLRLDNMIFHPSEPRVLAVLDWELSTLGNPLADFAYHALSWRLSSEQFRGMAEKQPLPFGVPDEMAYLRAYEQAVGRRIDRADYEYCIAYGMFRLAAILQGILKRSLDGTASSMEARQTGLKARAIAEEAWRQVERRLL